MSSVTVINHVLVLACLCFSLQDSCPPVEEGGSVNLTCRLKWDSKTSPYVCHWFIEDRDTASRSTVAQIHFNGVTVTPTVMVPFVKFAVMYTNGESILTVQNASRLLSPRVQESWRCEVNQQRILTTVCDSLEVYAKPVNPVCKNAVVNASTNQHTLTCTTEKVYPQAGCQLFYITKDLNQFQKLKPDISYQHVPWTDSVVYYKSTCIMSVKPQVGRSEYFKVLMYPEVRGSGDKFTVSSNIVHIMNLDTSLDNAGALAVETADSTSDVYDCRTWIIALGLLLAVAVVVAVFFANLWYRVRLNHQRPQAKTEETPIVEETPVVGEETLLGEETEQKVIVDGTPTDASGRTPAGDVTPIVEETPSNEETPIGEVTSIGEVTPVDEVTLMAEGSRIIVPAVTVPLSYTKPEAREDDSQSYTEAQDGMPTIPTNYGDSDAESGEYYIEFGHQYEDCAIPHQRRNGNFAGGDQSYVMLEGKPGRPTVQNNVGKPKVAAKPENRNKNQ